MGKVLMVTGGSRGIGAATALRAARDGWAVCVNYQGAKDRAEETVARVRAAGAQAIAVRADVADPAQVEALFAACDAALGPVTGLVNNAGIVGPSSRVDELDPAELARVLAINVGGSFHAARAAIRRMSTRHGGAGGVIVNLSSVAARLGGAGELVHYAASKGAIETMTVGLATEVGAEGIRVVAVAPGLIDTEIHAPLGGGERLARLASSVPMGRVGTAEEVAESIVWLLSDAAAYVSMTSVTVSGGR